MKVIFDLDGTLANIDHRLHMVQNGNKNWDGFYAACVHDTPKTPIIELALICDDAGHEIIISSGRSENVKVGEKILVTGWLKTNDRIYIGDLLEVKHVAGDFVFAQRKSQYSFQNDRIKLDLKEVRVERASPEFIAGHEWMTSKDAA